MGTARPEGQGLLASDRSSSDFHIGDGELKVLESGRASSSSDLPMSPRFESGAWKRTSARRLRHGLCGTRLRIFVTLAVLAVVALCASTLSGSRPDIGDAQGASRAKSAYSWVKGKLWKQRATWEKPKDFKIVAIVFYGRPRYVNILDCYLKKNLVKNGGYLDEVRFAVNTERKVDLDWLDAHIRDEPDYTVITNPDPLDPMNRYQWIWRETLDPDTLYVKIDDDVVFIDDDAIPRLTHSLMAHPEAHNMAANIVNSPIAHWLHFHTDAVRPWLPDPYPPAPEPADGNRSVDWRPSALPRYPFTRSAKYKFPPVPPAGAGFEVGAPGGPPFRHHRWLPMENTPASMAWTPVAAGADYNPFGRGLWEWTVAAQQHYSFFDHLEEGDLTPYWVGNAEGLWNLQYGRYNLNFLAIWGRNVAMMDIGTFDDEGSLTERIPWALKRPTKMDSHAIIVHFSYQPQTADLEKTDLLDRYRSYANEKVCTPHNQRVALSDEFSFEEEDKDRQAAKAAREEAERLKAKAKEDAEAKAKAAKEHEESFQA